MPSPSRAPCDLSVAELPDGLSAHIVLDQIAEIKSCVRVAIPVNMVLGAVNLLVAIQSDIAILGIGWFVASLTVNLGRLYLCYLPAPDMGHASSRRSPLRSIAVQRYLIWTGALLSGIVWAWVPILCAGYTAPQALFYLTVVCGVTAGAVTHGTPDARTPLCFMLPALASVVICLSVAGGFERACIAFTTIVYMAALSRSAIRAERTFKALSRAKNEATTNANALSAAHAHSLEVIDIMRYRATHDDLTGLLNRSGFLTEVEARMKAGQDAYCLMFIDLDGFKAVNDVYGHRKGDQVLIEAAKRLQAEISGESLLARMGGDEFAIFFPVTAFQEATDLAQAIIGAISIHMDGVDTGALGASIGIVMNLQADLTDILAYADEALYAAKNGGRNRYHVFDNALRERLEIRRDLERDLPRHLEDGCLDVWFQPIFALGHSMPDTIEALLRWKHPQHGWISPENLVRLAAINGHAEPLLRFVLQRVSRLLEALVRADLKAIKVAINISPREMAQLSVDTIILDHFEALGLAPPSLDVEITEETAFEAKAIQHKIQSLARAGVTISLDDFGVGYSSLEALRHRRVNRIKIDRSFVSNITRSPEDQHLVSAIIDYGRKFDIEVVIEGIETFEDYVMIQGLGGHLFQGYYLARPVPESDLLQYLRTREVEPSDHG
ncbi:EAL domain-containing protein [Sphingomonas sp.]|uniref:putative bifunctional diguanylate cyclase/phosphodiesterase n=1 Tax=Sphingomonas sp. TaxID=28214 RepID=UPI0031D73AC3